MYITFLMKPRLTTYLILKYYNLNPFLCNLSLTKSFSYSLIIFPSHLFLSTPVIINLVQAPIIQMTTILS